jgi:hypothetical protein
MQSTDLDPSLAFTALLELDPGFGKNNVEQGAVRRQQLLEAYHAQDEVRNLWDFTKLWLAGAGAQQ